MTKISHSVRSLCLIAISFLLGSCSNSSATLTSLFPVVSASLGTFLPITPGIQCAQAINYVPLRHSFLPDAQEQLKIDGRTFKTNFIWSGAKSQTINEPSCPTCGCLTGALRFSEVKSTPSSSNVRSSSRPQDPFARQPEIPELFPEKLRVQQLWLIMNQQEIWSIQSESFEKVPSPDTTIFDHGPSWSEINSSLVLIAKIVNKETQETYLVKTLPTQAIP